MASFSETIATLIDSIMRALGMKKGDGDKLEAQVKLWQQKQRDLNDEVESLKADIRETEGMLRAKSAELEATKGESREIVEDELKSTMQDLDQKKRKRDVIFGARDRLTILIEQAKTLATADRSKVGVAEIESLQDQFSLVLGDLKDVDRETRRLKDMEYKRESVAPRNYEERKAQYTAPTASQTTTEAPVQEKKPASTLSDDERERLRKIVENTN